MYLVTGGAGFIGSHTVAALVASGATVRVLDDLSTGRRSNLDGLDVELVIGSVDDLDAVERAGRGCTHVIHLAALASVPGSCADPLRYDSVNVHGTVTVFEAARRNRIARVVYASSSAVYGSEPTIPKQEGMRADVHSPYAASKAADEQYAATYSTTLGVECVGLRYFNVFGPRQDPNGPYAAVIPRFVHLALHGEPLTIFGDGAQGRDFVPVHDVARANLLAAQAPSVSGRVYNIGSGRMTTVTDLAALVLRAIPNGSEIRHQPPRDGDVRNSVADVARARRELGWKPEADFERAMAQTIDWYRGLLDRRRTNEPPNARHRDELRG